jgi:hypothetical protein
MHRLAVLITLVLMSSRIICGAERTENAPNHHTPNKLVESWLLFHESELCQSVDAAIVFNDNGMEVRYISKDEGVDQKLRELFQSPVGAYRVDLYPAQKPVEKKPDDDEESPPPSLFMNNELRKYLWEPPDISLLNGEEGYKRTSENREWAFEARLFGYAGRLIEWSRKAKRYAMDLPLLVRVAMDPSVASGTRLLAVTVCKAHAQNLEKDLSRLDAYLEKAFPKIDINERSKVKAEKPGKAGKTPVECAEHISEASQSAVRSIYQFIFPEQHTVTVKELRQPSLLENLKSLEKMVLDFQKALLRLTPRTTPVAGQSK